MSKKELKLLKEAFYWIEFLLPYANIGIDEYANGPELPSKCGPGTGKWTWKDDWDNGYGYEQSLPDDYVSKGRQLMDLINKLQIINKEK